MKLAVDALNLRDDRRGMGRLVRSVLRAAAQDGIDLTLLARESGDWTGGISVESPATASRRGRYDAVWYPWNGIRFRCAAPSLVFIHDTFALHEQGWNWIARRRVAAPVRRAARRASRIATNSEWTRTQIERDLHVAPERIAVVPLAPDELFSPGDAVDENLPAQPYVLLVGAGDRRKNARFLVRAFAEAFPERDVTLVTAGSLARDAAREAEKLRIRWVHEEPEDARLRDLYRAAACVAVPSLAEGFGLVAVEAQACGAPVIASNAAALPEAAGDAAILLGPHDVRAWRDALREVVRDANVATRLRALGVARWGWSRRDGPPRAILTALHDLVHQGS